VSYQRGAGGGGSRWPLHGHAAFERWSVGMGGLQTTALGMAGWLSGRRPDASGEMSAGEGGAPDQRPCNHSMKPTPS